jgi:hypothetical protein
MRRPIEINDSGEVKSEPPASTPMNPSTRWTAERQHGVADAEVIWT